MRDTTHWRRITVGLALLVGMSLIALVLLWGSGIIAIKHRRELVTMSGPLQFAIMDDAPIATIQRIMKDDPTSINVTDPILGTPMDRAIIKDRLDVMEILLAAGWDPDKKMQAEGERPCTPLGYAIRFGNIEAVKLLLDFGANPNSASWDGKSADQLCDEYLEGDTQRAVVDFLRAPEESKD